MTKNESFGLIETWPWNESKEEMEPEVRSESPEQRVTSPKEWTATSDRNGTHEWVGKEEEHVATERIVSYDRNKGSEWIVELDCAGSLEWTEKQDRTDFREWIAGPDCTEDLWNEPRSQIETYTRSETRIGIDTQIMIDTSVPIAPSHWIESPGEIVTEDLNEPNWLTETSIKSEAFRYQTNPIDIQRLTVCNSENSCLLRILCWTSTYLTLCL